MRVEPFGAWESPISATLLAESGIRLQEVQLDGDDAYWLEGRPTEAGRYVVVRRSPEGDVAEVTPPGFNVRTRVHEYGGGSYVVHGGKVFSSSFADQRLYRQDGPRGEPTAITPEPPRPASLRYADGRAVGGGRWIVCVHERHEGDAATDVVNELVAVPADGSSEPVVIADGHDFFSFPRPSPDGRRLAWTTWDHPNMPWDGSDLWVAELTVSEDGVSLGEPRHVAGGPGESIFQPAWSPSGELHFVSDRSNWWNLYRERDGRIEPLHPMEAEFGGPQWIFGFSTYDFLEDGRIACAYVREGRSHLAVLDPEAGSLESLDLPFTGFGFLRTHGRRVFCLAGSPTEHAAVVAIDPGSGDVEVIRRSSDLELDPGYVSVARPIEFPTAGERTAHALHYPPTNRDFRGPDGERPPLLVLSHGGPTSMARAELNVEIQFWTSRGFAVVDVNYGGSTGYGREYRDRLKGTWGVVDVDDCIAAARYLADEGLVDGERLAVRGGSAGGYTTLCALTFRPEVFAAGASYFGVADVEALVRDTHKFESRYIDQMIGPWPEAVELYRERSPIHHVDRLSSPLILLQGLEDEVVPPAQAEVMAEALAAKGIPYAYIAFEGEQHGFRKAENIRAAAESELSFYAQIFNFTAAGDVPKIQIHGLS